MDSAFPYRIGSDRFATDRIGSLFLLTSSSSLSSVGATSGEEEG